MKMFKYLISFVLLTGCGMQNTNEAMMEKYTRDFAADCRSVYGDACDKTRLEPTVERNAPNGTCWTEEGSSKRGLALNQELVEKQKKTSIYKEMFECSLNFGFLQETHLQFSEFADRLGLNPQD